MRYLKILPAILGAILIFGCDQGEQQDATAKAANPGQQKIKGTEKPPGQRLQQGVQAMNKAAEVEKELAKKAEENEREIEKESR